MGIKLCLMEFVGKMHIAFRSKPVIEVVFVDLIVDFAVPGFDLDDFGNGGKQGNCDDGGQAGSKADCCVGVKICSNRIDVSFAHCYP